jgi:hypothetical protein
MQKTRRINAAARVERYFRVRYRTERELTAWRFDGQGGSMIANVAQQTEPIPGKFAHLPAARTWPELVDHARQLAGAAHIGLFGEGEFNTWVAFELDSYYFTLSGDANEPQLVLTVDDARCDPALLALVCNHFDELLSAS